MNAFTLNIKKLCPGCCKLDLEKAYDIINWDFLLYILHLMWFGQKWRRWIEECVSSAYFSVLINGIHKAFFRPKGK